MLASSLYLLLGATVAFAASPLAERSFLGVQKRSLQAGFAVQTTNCPTGSSLCQSHWCCPDTLTCSVTNDTTVDNVCCNGSDDCFAALTASPVCADSSWGLYLATTTAPFNGDPNVAASSGEFCCQPGEVGTINAECLSPGVVPAGQGASSLLPNVSPMQQTTSTSAATTATTGSAQPSSSSGSSSSGGSSGGSTGGPSGGSSGSSTGSSKSQGSTMDSVPLPFSLAVVSAILGLIFA